MASKKTVRDSIRDITCGTVGGIAQTVVGHPLDTSLSFLFFLSFFSFFPHSKSSNVAVKVRLQTQGEQKLYKNAVDCFVKTLKDEGIGGLFRGVGSPLAGQAFMSAFKFFYYGQVRNLIAGRTDWKPEDLSIRQYFLAGAITGFFNTFLDSPVDLFKSKMQAQKRAAAAAASTTVGGSGAVSAEPVYKNVFDCAKQIVTKYGIVGVYQGLGITFLRDMGGNCAYFGVYESVRRYRTPPGGTVADLKAYDVLLAGGFAGLGYWTSIYPIDVIKSSMQTDASNKKLRLYKNMWDCAQKLYR